jgi:hypothetical protein
MTKYIAFVLITSLSFFCLVSCGGGDGNGGDKFTVFDVTITVLGVESQIGAPTDCPENANLKLSLTINEKSISGFAELIGFGKVGDASAVSGEIINNEFILNPFVVGVLSDVPPDAFFPASSISFDFQEFQGLYMDEDDDGLLDIMEGEVSGTVFENTGDVVICFDAEFTGEFSGEAKKPRGCVSKAELTLVENRDCPAEAISNLCDGVSYLCEIPESMPPGDFPINNSCVAIGCFTIDCPISPEITNLQLGINGGINGNFVTSEGIGEPISCFGPSGRL